MYNICTHTHSHTYTHTQEDCDYVQKLGVTIELMNKNIFRELIFAESFMSSNLPLITAQLRLASLASDPYHRSAADDLSQRYVDVCVCVCESIRMLIV